MDHASVPKSIDISRALSGILNKNVKATAIKDAPWVLKTSYVGHYDDGNGACEGIWISDMPLSASLGAALSLIPSGVAQESVKAGQLTAEILDNTREVANIVANSYGSKRVRLIDFLRGDGVLPADVQALMAKPGQQVSFQIDVAGYAGGILIFLGQPLPTA